MTTESARGLSRVVGEVSKEFSFRGMQACQFAGGWNVDAGFHVEHDEDEDDRVDGVGFGSLLISLGNRLE